MIDKYHDEKKTETGFDSLQSLRAYLQANLRDNKSNLVIVMASPTSITMLASPQARTKVYRDFTTPLNVLSSYKSMPDPAEARSCHSSLDERRKGNPQRQQVHLHKCVLIND